MEQIEKDGKIIVKVDLNELIDERLIAQIYIHTGKLLTREELKKWRKEQENNRSFGTTFAPCIPESEDTLTLTFDLTEKNKQPR